MPSQFVNTSFIAGGTDDGSEDESHDEEDETNDALALIELLSELWVTVGVAAPLFLFILSLVRLTMSGDGVLTLWLAPTATVGATAIVVAVVRLSGQPMRSASEREHAELRSTLTMTVLILWVSILIGLSVLVLLQTQFVSELSSLAESTEVPTHKGLSSGDLAIVQTVAYTMGITYILAGVVLTVVFRGGLERPLALG